MAAILLLVDSDGPRTSLPDDANWHYMVQVMESWFLADRETLLKYYGPRFQSSSLPGNPRVEEISKGDVFQGLRRATKGTPKGSYHKIQHAVDLLSGIDPQMVRRSSPHCERLLQTLAACF